MIWQHSGHVAQVHNEHRTRVALLHLDENRPVVLEGTAATVWELIDGRRTEQSILAELGAIFEDQSGHLQVQVESFLAGLEARRLIEPASNASH